MSALDGVVEDALLVLEGGASGLITDIDGTISPIVPRPEDAVVSAEARDALARLARSLSLVAVVTAREESVARAMVGVDGLAYVGNYALDDSFARLCDLVGA